MSMRAFALVMGLVVGLFAVRIDGVHAQDLTLELQRADGTTRSVSVSEVEALGLESFVEMDPFVEREIEYSGVPLQAFIHFFGGESAEKATFTGIDDYAYSLETPNWGGGNLYLVTRQDGRRIGHREKGPFRIVDRGYDHARLSSKYSFNEWVWMIKKVTIQ